MKEKRKAEKWGGGGLLEEKWSLETHIEDWSGGKSTKARWAQGQCHSMYNTTQENTIHSIVYGRLHLEDCTVQNLPNSRWQPVQKGIQDSSMKQRRALPAASAEQKRQIAIFSYSDVIKQAGLKMLFLYTFKVFQ